MPLIMRGRKCRAEVEDPSDEDDEVPFAPVRQNTGMSLDAQPPEATTNTPSVALSLKYDRLEKLFRARACILVVRCPNHDHSHLPAEVEEIVLFVAKTLHGGRGLFLPRVHNAFQADLHRYSIKLYGNGPCNCPIATQDTKLPRGRPYIICAYIDARSQAPTASSRPFDAHQSTLASSTPPFSIKAMEAAVFPLIAHVVEAGEYKDASDYDNNAVSALFEQIVQAGEDDDASDYDNNNNEEDRRQGNEQEQQQSNDEDTGVLTTLIKMVHDNTTSSARHYFRIGSIASKKLSKHEIDRVCVVFACVPTSASSTSHAVGFFIADAFTIGGVQYGRVMETCTAFNIDEDKWQPDASFVNAVKGSRLDRNALMRKIAGGRVWVEDIDNQGGRFKVQGGYGIESDSVEDAQGGDMERRKDGNATRQTIRLKKLPVAPAYAVSGAPPVLDKSKSSKIIHCVLNFINKTGIELQLPELTNRQCEMKPTESFQDLHKHIMHEDIAANGHSLVAYLKGKLHNWEIEIFVLPQIRGLNKMWSWTKFPDMTTKQWLHGDAKDDRLYMEVHIKLVAVVSGDELIEAEDEAGIKTKKKAKKGKTTTTRAMSS